MLKGAITCKKNKQKKVYNEFTLPKCLEKSDIFFDILPPCPDKDSSFHLNVVHYLKKRRINKEFIFFFLFCFYRFQLCFLWMYVHVYFKESSQNLRLFGNARKGYTFLFLT